MKDSTTLVKVMIGGMVFVMFCLISCNMEHLSSCNVIKTMTVDLIVFAGCVGSELLTLIFTQFSKRKLTTYHVYVFDSGEWNLFMAKCLNV